MVKTALTYSLILFLITACSDKEQEVIDLSEIIPTSSNDYASSDSVGTTSVSDGNRAYFNQNGFQFDEVKKVKERLFPDRFGPDTSLVYDLIKGQDTLRYHKWIFGDSVKVMNAFYNWIDCFGAKCKSLFIGQEANLQVNASQIIVSDTSLIFIEGKNIVFKDWYGFHDAIGYENNWNFYIEQPYRGKAKWYVLDGDKKTKYTKK